VVRRLRDPLLPQGSADKYHFSHPPTTWKELGSQAKTIQAGERGSNKNFYGFVYQGNSYEGLTCDSLEWIASSNGGHFIDGKKASINNAHAVAILNLFRGWVGTIAPRGVTSYGEEEARNAFDAGNAAFMRNWPYAYSASQTTPVKGKFDVTVLPHGSGGHSVGTVGGWQVAVSKYSNHQAAAIAWAKYYAGKPTQIWRAVHSTIVPTMPSVGSVASVKKVMPFLSTVGSKETRATRPSTVLRTKYNQGSTIFYQGVNQILTGSSVDSTVSSIASQLKNLHP